MVVGNASTRPEAVSTARRTKSDSGRKQTSTFGRSRANSGRSSNAGRTSYFRGCDIRRERLNVPGRRSAVTADRGSAGHNSRVTGGWRLSCSAPEPRKKQALPAGFAEWSHPTLCCPSASLGLRSARIDYRDKILQHARPSLRRRSRRAEERTELADFRVDAVLASANPGFLEFQY